MGSSILKITTTGLRCVFTTPNPLRGVRRMVSNSSSISRFSFFNSDDQSQVSRSSSSSPPWLMLSPRSQDTTYKLYNFAENKVLAIAKPDLKEGYEATKIYGSSHGWLACSNHLRGGEVFLLNPLSGRRVNLPPIDKLPEIPEYNFKHGQGCISKILISCSDPESEECRVMMSFGWVNRLAFCCPGKGSDQWTVIGSEKEVYYDDFVYCATQGLFISVKFHFEELEAWDLRDPLSPRLVWSHRGRKVFGIRKYIVESQQQGEHFLVYRYVNKLILPDGSCAEFDPLDYWKYPCQTVDFTVQKIVREGDGVTTKMVEMDGHLDGLVMFIGGLSHGMAMPASDAHGFQPNTICFTDDCLGSCASEYGTDNGIFNYEKKTFSSCYYTCDDYESRKIYTLPPPLWFTPNPN